MPHMVDSHAVSSAIERACGNLRLPCLLLLLHAETIIFDSEGKMYTMEKGGIYQADPDGSNRSLYVYTGGRPLGAKFDSHGNLYFADLAKVKRLDSRSNHPSLFRAYVLLPYIRVGCIYDMMR